VLGAHFAYVLLLRRAWNLIAPGRSCRTFADIHSGRTHIANNPAATGRNMGAVMLGLPNTDTFI